MVITKQTPFTSEEISQMKEVYGEYIKTVIDIRKKICVGGVVMHVDGEQLLIQENSNQSDIWGGGIDIKTTEIDFQSMINIRPHDNNMSNIIANPDIQNEYSSLTKYFFKLLYE
ncbi:hypothetical protein KBA63_00835 [Candidatus Woesebacteria bacterium]|jgi:hypothetical protein|nr:hypothetical protein [Candidatus Woesebacteria bacterium]MBP9687430.1 hypothetical protein [Candidatus Woesebacteria bacterium]